MNLKSGSIVRLISVSCSVAVLLFGATIARAQQADASMADAKKPKPPITQVAGTWTGTVDAGPDGSGPFTLTLEQNGKKITGNFNFDTGDASPSGPVTGKISGDNLSMKFVDTNPDEHPCTATVVATVTDNSMSGTYLVKGSKKHCNGKGTFDLTLQ